MNNQKDLELLKSVNEVINLRGLKDKLFGKEEEESRATPDSTTESESALARIASEATTVTSGEKRIVIYLSHKDLVSLYLKSGGGKALIDAMTDEEITNFSKDQTGKDSRIKKLPDVFTFSDLLDVPANKFTAGADSCVIIDFPSSIDATLKSSAVNLQKMRATLIRLMNHAYYVMTLSIPKAKKIESQVKATTDIESLKEVFDPNIIVNYPIKQIKVAAIDEWDEMKKPPEKKPEEKPEDEEEEKPGEEEKPEEEPELKHQDIVVKMKDLWSQWKNLEAAPPLISSDLKNLIRKMYNDLPK